MVRKVESREKRQNRVASRLRSGLRLAPTTARKTLCPLSLPYLRLQDPRGGLGNSKNRNLERLGVPLARLGGPTKGGLGNSKSRNLEFGGPSGCGPSSGGLGNSETRNLEFGGCFLADPQHDPQRALGNSETRNLEFAEEYPGESAPLSWKLCRILRPAPKRQSSYPLLRVKLSRAVGS
jgi:hypothetical protein